MFWASASCQEGSRLLAASSPADGLVLKAKVCWPHSAVLCCPLSRVLYNVLFPVIDLVQAKRYGELEMCGKSPPLTILWPPPPLGNKAASQRTVHSPRTSRPLNGERQAADCLHLVCNLFTWGGTALRQHLVFSMFPGPCPGFHPIWPL